MSRRLFGWRAVPAPLVCILLLLGCLVVQSTLAHASPLQQTWMPGVFDDASPADPPPAASEIAALLPGLPAGPSGPLVIVLGSVAPAPDSASPAPSRAASRTRAPPLV